MSSGVYKRLTIMPEWFRKSLFLSLLCFNQFGNVVCSQRSCSRYISFIFSSNIVKSCPHRQLVQIIISVLSLKEYFLIGQELVWPNFETTVKTEVIGHLDTGFPIDRECLIQAGEEAQTS